MTGICGAISLDPSRPLEIDVLDEPRRLLDRFIAAGVLVHREAAIELAQHRHAQVPESVGLTACVRLVAADLTIVGDLRLDNRRELGSQLGFDEAETRTWPDETFVLWAHERWGDEAPEHLLGSFAYALWDGRRQRLQLVRDPMGVRPLYYFVAEATSTLVFASSLAGLIAQPAAPRTVNDKRLADFLTLHDDLESTSYRGVSRLPPGHRLTVHDGVVSKRAYHRLTLPPELRLADASEYAERFRELLVEAVRCRLRSPHAPSILLSGGLDSSAVAGIVRQCGDVPKDHAVATFSGLFTDYPEIDERVWIDRVLARGRFAPHFRRLDRASPLADIERDLDVHAQPFYCPNNYTDTVLLDCAREHGAQLMLDGIDGDTTVGHGFEFLGQLLREGRWRRLLSHARAFARLSGRSTWWFLRTHALGPTWHGWRERGRSPTVPAHVAPELAARVDLSERLRARRAAQTWSQLSPFREQHFGKITSAILPIACELLVEQGLSRGIVRRHPYLDLRLIEFCLALPAEQRLSAGADRVVQRRAVLPFVPHYTAHRLTKAHFEENTMDRLAADDRERLLALRSARDRLAGYIAPAALDAAVNGVLDRRGRGQDFVIIWMAALLERWLRQV